MNRLIGAILLDAIAIVGFATLGRASHGGADTAMQVLAVAAPFLIGAAIGWAGVAATGRWRAPHRIASGVIIAATTLVIGLGYRLIIGAAAPAFVVVAVLSLSLLLIGWRAVATVLQRLARGTRPA